VYQYQTKQNPVHNLQNRFHPAKDIVVQKPGGVCKIFTETGTCDELAHYCLRLLDCVRNLIQDCFKQIHVLFGGGFPTKFFGVF
jgi:hypothetical protein